jgi:DNA polymerase I
VAAAAARPAKAHVCRPLCIFWPAAPLPARHRDGVGDGGFSDAAQPGDRVLAIGLQFWRRERLLSSRRMTDAAEKKRLLEAFNAVLRELDPDTIEGHNIFKFDLDYLRQRCRRHKCRARGAASASGDVSQQPLKVAERWIDFPRCDLPGRAVVDTYLLVQLYDITTREMTAYGLKDVAVYFGITDEDSAERTYIEGAANPSVPAGPGAVLRLPRRRPARDPRGGRPAAADLFRAGADVSDCCCRRRRCAARRTRSTCSSSRNTTTRASCPVPPEVQPFEGGYTRSFQEGVFRHVLHFDVASLYPSLLLQIGRNPRTTRSASSSRCSRRCANTG